MPRLRFRNLIRDALSKRRAALPLKISGTRIIDLPLEILIIISAWLALKDLKNFRLANGAIAIAASDVLRPYIGELVIPLTRDFLLSFKTSMPPASMWCCVDVARIEEPAKPAATEIQELSGLLKNILRACTKHGKLNSLSIQTVTRAGFTIVMTTLQDSNLSLITLNMFPDIDRKAVAIDAYHEVSNTTLLKSTLHSITNLSMTLATRKTHKHAEELLDSQQCAPRNITALCHFLGLMPNIRSLDLRWIKIPIGLKQERLFLDEYVESSFATHRLEKCALRGIFLAEKTLLTILKAATLRHVTLQHISISGKFISATEVLTSGKFDTFHLDDVFEEGDDGKYHILHFKTPGCTKFPYRDDDLVGPSEVIRGKYETTIPLEYRYPEGPPKGGPPEAGRHSNAFKRWLGESVRLYGSEICDQVYHKQVMLDLVDISCKRSLEDCSCRYHPHHQPVFARHATLWHLPG